MTYTPGIDDPDVIHRRIDAVFPRCYRREVVEAARSAPESAAGRAGVRRRGFRETVMEYLRERLDLETDPNAAAVLALADELIAEARR